MSGSMVAMAAATGQFFGFELSKLLYMIYTWFIDFGCLLLRPYFLFCLAAMNPGLSFNINVPTNQALNLPSQPIATHCFQLSNMFNPNS